MNKPVEISPEEQAILAIAPVVVDPINLDTYPPEEPKRHVEPHTPKPSKPVQVVLDKESPLKRASDGRIDVRIGSAITFGRTNPFDSSPAEERWVVIRLEDDACGSFTAQHETNGLTYRGLIRHIHKVIKQ